MKNDRVPVMVPIDVYDKLKSYSKCTGSTATAAIVEALEDWLDTVGQARLEALGGIKIEDVLLNA